MRYVLFLTDLIGSTKIKVIKEREDLFSKLEFVLKEANENFRKHFVIPPQIVRGIDEFGAVLKRLENSFEIIDYIYENMLPYVYRFVLAEDDIKNIESKKVNELDGEAVHEASRLIERLKDMYEEENHLFKISLKERSELNKSKKLISEILEDYVWLIWRHKARWTIRQLEVVRLYRRLQKQSDVAKELRVSQINISRILSNADFKFIRELERKANRMFGIVESVVK